MDLQDVIGKLIRLRLKSGRVLSGWVQEPDDRSMLTTIVPFLTVERAAELRERYGKLPIAVPITEASDIFELVERSQIDSFELIETTAANIQLVTEGHKPINILGSTIELKAGRLGCFKVRYKLPENAKWFDLGELEIKESVLELPVTMAFVSYAKEDRERVASISRDLNDNGILTWFDEKMLLPGDDWQSRIEQAIEQADYFLLFLSSRTMDRNGYKNKELCLALEQKSLRPVGKRFLIPILLDELQIHGDLAKLHWLTATGNNWFKNLLRAIAPIHIQQELWDS